MNEVPAPYDQLVGKRVRVRDRTAAEYEGVLVAWDRAFILLQNGNGERVWVKRTGDNIASVRLLPNEDVGRSTASRTPAAPSS